MLKVTKVKKAKFVSLIEFYDLIIGDKHNYCRWLKQYVTHHPIEPVEGSDFIRKDKKQVGRGRQRKEILISVDFLKQLCFDIGTKKCREVRQWANTQF